jgi:transcriptional regulator with XRE-family HTH domain
VGDAGNEGEPLVAGSSSGEIAGLVRRCREAAGLTQTDLAKLTGSTQSMVARWEKGRTEMTFATLERLAHALGRELTVRFGAEPRP